MSDDQKVKTPSNSISYYQKSFTIAYVVNVLSLLNQKAISMIHLKEIY